MMNFLNNNDFKGKTYIVVGGSSGIGLSCSKRLLELEANVILASRNPLEKVKEISHEKNLKTFSMDVTETESIKDFVLNLPSIDGGLVYSPGYLPSLALFYQQNEKEIEAQMAVGPMGFSKLMKILVKKKILQSKSSVVVVSSAATCLSPLASSSYNSAKSALSSLATSYARELAYRKKNIRVNTVSFGYVKSNLVKQVNNIDEKTLLKIPYAEEASVNGPILFFLSNLSEWMSGENLIVDGGSTLKMGLR